MYNAMYNGKGVLPFCITRGFVEASLHVRGKETPLHEVGLGKGSLDFLGKVWFALIR
jgi:hypothetical protein